MPQEVRMPALGQTTDELRIVTWLKAAGDPVALGEPLLEVETDKATLAVESFLAGTVLKIVRGEGETVPAGTVIAYVGARGEAVPGSRHDNGSVTLDAPDRSAPEGAAGPAHDAPVHPAQHAPAHALPHASAHPAPHVPAGPAHDGFATAPGSTEGKALASPVARQLARTHGIDLGRVSGSGPGGRIEKADVLALVDGAAGGGMGREGTGPDTHAGQGGVMRDADAGQTRAMRDIDAGRKEAEPGADLPVPRQRQVIARRLTQSIQTIPQITLTVAVDMSQARTWLERQRQAGLAGLTYTHLLLRAVAGALRGCPHMNRLWLADGPRYRQLARADVGLAVAGDDTLLTVTIPEPDRAGLADLVALTGAAVRRGRAGTLAEADMAPAAVTLSNLGMHGVDSFQAIVDPTQTAILATGRIAEHVVVGTRVSAGGIHVVPRMEMSLSVDHRVADGVAAARFLRSIAVGLEQVEA